MWYVVQTTNGMELSAIEKCKNAIPATVAESIFSPTYECMSRYEGAWHTNRKILFPGYLFIESSQRDALEKSLQHILGVVSPVRIGGGFYPIGQEEEDFLRSMMDETYCVKHSLGFIVDGQLIVKNGLLCGKTAFIRKIDRHKRIAEFVVQLFEEEKRIKVGLEVPAKITAAEYQKMKATA